MTNMEPLNLDDIDNIDFDAGNFEIDMPASHQTNSGTIPFGDGDGSDTDSNPDAFIPPNSHETPCEFLTGPAGSGKTTELRRRLEADPLYAVMSASSGIAAVNLNATTIHSLL